MEVPGREAAEVDLLERTARSHERAGVRMYGVSDAIIPAPAALPPPPWRGFQFLEFFRRCVFTWLEVIDLIWAEMSAMQFCHRIPECRKGPSNLTVATFVHRDKPIFAIIINSFQDKLTWAVFQLNPMI